ncbi:hypothetical protein C731_4909 [Mycolicibacterium hassiacum DSM 44199]|uniref:Uncharacterized protein n=1 Tax=Mycolicibacterium hassiacum (strain DSM 44199 / CIP 105218 / JCM 12690 / 3849) TaxID=1122247 RepID=K5BCW1_MYCHD|nr:hypothetical protein [Mycolicibacterium hassiacum]EKF21121.1 hypothetical protein C731_4909 [Mycolicibacterium hassiacum DSM 44199]MDA4085075.1 hypothetical protein [Mycolicibacterium hassiacum DSM 44199]VCT89012.1 hypothetical protein MHAS_00698 [Mycolicibacterium hassiacum DSM 44199]
MASKRTIAELAERKSELTDELREVDAEINSRAGERDESDADDASEPVKQTKAATKPAKVETATDKSAENAENTSATT